MITLVDAGPLVALIDQGQGEHHRRCVAAQRTLTAPLLTSWPCFTEAMYLLGRVKGWAGQQLLWRLFLENNGVALYHLNDSEVRECRR